MESLFFVYFSASQDSRTHKAHEKNKGIEMSIASSKRPSTRARSARASAQGAPAKSCRLVAMCALASLAWVATFSSFALLQEPFARGSPEGSKSYVCFQLSCVGCGPSSTCSASRILHRRRINLLFLRCLRPFPAVAVLETLEARPLPVP